MADKREIQENLNEAAYRLGRFGDFIKINAEEGHVPHIDDASENLMDLTFAAIQAYDAAGGDAKAMAEWITAELKRGFVDADEETEV
jgi:hypothetical protein